jgi:hypothetical protein
MKEVPIDIKELLHHAYLSDANDSSLLRRLVAAVEHHFDDEDEAVASDVQATSTSETDPDVQHEEGWESGLGAALSLVQMAELEIHEEALKEQAESEDGAREDQADLERGAAIALNCIGRAIETAIQVGSEYEEADDLGLRRKLREDLGERPPREPTARKAKPHVRASTTHTPPAEVPMTGGKHQRTIVEYVRSSLGSVASRPAIRKHLIDIGATTVSGAYGPIERAIQSGLVEDLGDGLIGLRKL